MRRTLLLTLLPLAATAAAPPTPTRAPARVVKPDPPRILAEASSKIAEGLSRTNAELARDHAKILEASSAAVKQARSRLVTPLSVRQDALQAEALQIRARLSVASAGEREVLQKRINQLLGEGRSLAKPGRPRPQ